MESTPQHDPDQNAADPEPARPAGPPAGQRLRLPPAVVEQLTSARVGLGAWHLAVIMVVLVAAAGWAGWSWVQARPSAVEPPRPQLLSSGKPSRGSASPATSGHGTAPGLAGRNAYPATPSAEPVVVDVVGKVRRPGVVRLPPGSRVADALAKAGGALPGVNLTSLNLARKVNDGEQIAVGITLPSVPQLPPAPTVPPLPTVPPNSSAPSANAATPAGRVNLNTASVAQLEALPGVGPVTAQRIIDWRTQHGRFTSIDELQEIDGIGPKKFEALRRDVTI